MDDLYSNIQLPCQVVVKVRLLIGIADGDDDEQDFAGMAIVDEGWRADKALSAVSLSLSPPRDQLLSENKMKRVRASFYSALA